MKKEILNEINRFREISGLPTLILKESSDPRKEAIEIIMKKIETQGIADVESSVLNKLEQSEKEDLENFVRNSQKQQIETFLTSKFSKLDLSTIADDVVNTGTLQPLESQLQKQYDRFTSNEISKELFDKNKQSIYTSYLRNIDKNLADEIQISFEKKFGGLQLGKGSIQMADELVNSIKAHPLFKETKWKTEFSPRFKELKNELSLKLKTMPKDAVEKTLEREKDKLLKQIDDYMKANPELAKEPFWTKVKDFFTNFGFKTSLKIASGLGGLLLLYLVGKSIYCAIAATENFEGYEEDTLSTCGKKLVGYKTKKEIKKAKEENQGEESPSETNKKQTLSADDLPLPGGN